MSSKLNITEIFKGHFATLKLAGGTTSKTDLFIFIVFPAFIAVMLSVYDLEINKDMISLLVNFGAIFTALLLSVLVLVYDQEVKNTCMKIKNEPLVRIKKTLLHELYYNISFSIILSVFLVILSLLYQLIDKNKLHLSFYSVEISLNFGDYLIKPLMIFVTLTIFLNVIMIVKRMHILLTS